jgi:hypothetical protein
MVKEIEELGSVNEGSPLGEVKLPLQAVIWLVPVVYCSNQPMSERARLLSTHSSFLLTVNISINWGICFSLKDNSNRLKRRILAQI